MGEVGRKIGNSPRRGKRKGFRRKGKLWPEVLLQLQLSFSSKGYQVHNSRRKAGSKLKMQGVSEYNMP